jgi:ABC-2 type transport system ATP-binding protein
MLQFDRLRKAYGNKLILDIPSLELAPGVYWLQGPNGTGKTTLLRVVAGILSFEGDIRLQGRSLRNEPVAYRRLVGWADAEPLYPGFLNGSDLLAFYRGILQPEPDQVERLCAALAVDAWLNSRLDRWSSGMTKKISLVLALLGQPALVLLDEPFSTLDQEGTTALCALMTEYHRLYNTGFLLSSHQGIDPDWIQGLSKLKLNDRNIQLAE